MSDVEAIELLYAHDETGRQTVRRLGQPDPGPRWHFVAYVAQESFWHELGKWCVHLAVNGEHGNLAPPNALTKAFIDTVTAAHEHGWQRGLEAAETLCKSYVDKTRQQIEKNSDPSELHAAIACIDIIRALNRKKS